MMLYDNLHFYTLGMAALVVLLSLPQSLPYSSAFSFPHQRLPLFMPTTAYTHGMLCLYSAVKAVVELGIILSVNKNRDTYTEQKFSR